MRKLAEYHTFVFDCDGVVLNSNRIKTKAFYNTVLPYGEAIAADMVNYHVAHGGISRYQKFSHFLNCIAPKNSYGNLKIELDKLLESYAAHVKSGLLSCDMAQGLDELRMQYSNARWLIVSGGDQSELRQVFALRGIVDLFDGGIFGSPDTKDEILQREFVRGNIKLPGIFLGDSKYDHAASTKVGLDFLFISAWSEVSDWQKWVGDNQIVFTPSLQSLLE